MALGIVDLGLDPHAGHITAAVVPPQGGFWQSDIFKYSQPMTLPAGPAPVLTASFGPPQSTFTKIAPFAAIGAFGLFAYLILRPPKF